MSSVTPPTTNASQASVSAPRPEISFNQRHAWMREYEHAEQGRTAPAGNDAASPSSPEPAALPATDTAVMSERAHDARQSTAQGGQAVHGQGTARPAHGAQVPGPATTAPTGFVSTATWLQPQATQPARSIAMLAATPPSPRTARPAGREIAEHELTLCSSDDSLSLTLRNASLGENQARELLRQLNASGATLGRRVVSVTVNGVSLVQHTTLPSSD